MFMPLSSHATIGLAEWQINTPGGHVIRHQDGWKDLYGDCLTSNERDPTVSLYERNKVYVSHLKRWRYYPGVVTGESSTQGYFLFDEDSKIVAFFETRDDLQAVLSEKRIEHPLSPWLTGRDGWEEAWFFDFVWRPCQILHRGGASSDQEAGYLKATGMTVKKCLDTITPELLKRFALTSWGQMCREGKTGFRPGERDRQSTEEADWLKWCRTLERGTYSIEKK